MPIRSATLVEHRVPLTPPVVTARRTWTERRSLLLRVEAADGAVGHGEASPLPGYSSDDYEAVRSALEHLDWAALDRAPALPPAAQFAVDAARLDLEAHREGVPAWRVLTAAPPSRVPLATVLHAAEPSLLAEEIAAARAAGYLAFKLKLGPDAAGDLRRGRALRLAAPDAELRLDANRSLPRATVRERLAPWVELTCSFIEEPCANVDYWADATDVYSLCAALPVPLALDESLQDARALTALPAFLARVPVAALVLKPMALGGLSPVQRLAALGAQRGVPRVVSHLFDGPVALAAAGVLALAVGSPGTAQGLAPHSGLAAWGTPPHPGFAQGALRPWSEVGLGVALDAT